jgi:hypothetical protein
MIKINDQGVPQGTPFFCDQANPWNRAENSLAWGIGADRAG